METLSKVPHPPYVYTGEIINGRIVGNFHRVEKYWMWDWTCVVHGTQSKSPLRIKDIKNKKGPRCCQQRKGKYNPSWKGFGDIPMRYFNQVKKSAESRGLCFELSIEDMQNQWDMQKGICRYTGDYLRVGPSDIPNLQLGSLDRIDSKLGYTVDNIQWVRADVNMSKQRLSDDEFLSMCIQIAQYQKAI